MSKQKHNLKQRILAHMLAGTFFVFLLGMSFVSTHTVHAQATDVGKFSRFTVIERCNKPGVECNWKDFLDLGNEILKFAIFIAILGCTVVLTYAGFKMILNQGNSGEISKAKSMMMKSITGLIITMCAYLIVDFILDALIPKETPEFRSLVK